MQPSGVITLLTDFGLQDGYVAAMKGVILQIAPQARVVDVTHEVTPQAIAPASYLLQTTYRYFPVRTVHVAVVDPGVGSERRALAVATPEAFFVAPDNGLLAPVVEEGRTRFGSDVEIVELTEPRYWRSEVSATFHGRDIFAPVAAHLANGLALARLGRRIEEIMPGVVEPPGVDEQGALAGAIVHVDRFGNCITNITAQHLQEYGAHERLRVEIAGQSLGGLYRTYSEAPEGVPIGLIGSSGHLELALRNGSAARALGVATGERLKVARAG